MAKGYWIGHVDVNNDEGYKPYAAANPAIFKKFGGRFVVRGGKFESSRRQQPLAQCGDRISELSGGARLLQLAGISGQHQGPEGRTPSRRHHRHRRLRRPAALTSARDR